MNEKILIRFVSLFWMISWIATLPGIVPAVASDMTVPQNVSVIQVLAVSRGGGGAAVAGASARYPRGSSSLTRAFTSIPLPKIPNNEIFRYGLRGTSLSLAAVVYALTEMPVESAKKLAVIYSAAMGFIHPWNGQFWDPYLGQAEQPS
eukprot:scaffold2204_cov166-Amphora_coffeaeformis.AAC.13